MAWPVYTFSRQLLVGIGVVGVLAACSGTPTPIVSPAVGKAPLPTASSGVPVDDDPPGSVACGELKDAVTAASLMEPGVVDKIVRLSSTADAPVADSAQRLAVAYAAAVTAHGSDSEPDAVAAVSVAGADMTKVCSDSGLDTVG
jgi:hypothetical protein